MALVENRPHERNRHRLDAFLDEEPAGGAHVVLVQRCLDRAVGDDALARAFAQIARHQHDCRGIFGIVAVSVLLVAEPDFDRIFVAGGADQTGLAAFVLNQGVEPDGRAVDAEVGIRKRSRREFRRGLRQSVSCLLRWRGSDRRASRAPCTSAHRPIGAARTRSVKVPPASMPRRYFVRIAFLRR